MASLLGYFFLRRFEFGQVYHPSRLMETSGAALGRAFEDCYFSSADGVRLNGWFFPADTNSPHRDLVVLFCHGNAGNISHRLEVCQALLDIGVNVFLFDYRGYGRSEGRPTEEGTYQDAQAAVQWLKKQGFAGGKIIAFGESLGGGVASELAVREPVGGLTLQSTFTSVPELGAELFPWLPVHLLSAIKYNTVSKLHRLKVPVLVMHSRTDGLVGFHHSEKNFAAANPPKLFCEIKGDHNNPLTDRQAFTAGFEKFLGMVNGK